MDIESIEKALNSEPMTFTATEIQELLDEELSKNPSEIDMELVERCIDILEKAIKDENTDVEKEGVEKKHIKLRKIVLIAAIAAMFFAIAIPVSAKYINSNISDKIVRFYSDYFSIDLRGEESYSGEYYKGDAFINDLKGKGFDNVVLPDDMLEYDFSKDLEVQYGDEITAVNTVVNVPNENIDGTVSIILYNNDTDFLAGKTLVSNEYEYIDQVIVNDINIIVYSNGNNVHIQYLFENTEYNINLKNCTFKLGLDIAKTIK